MGDEKKPSTPPSPPPRAQGGTSEGTPRSHVTNGRTGGYETNSNPPDYNKKA